MVALYRASQDDSKLAALLEMVDARIVTPELDRFLPVMYGQTVSPLAHVSGKALVVLSEPRSLFDDCLRAYEDIEARAGEAGIDRLDGLYVRAQQLDFGAQQRLNYVSLIRAGGAVTAELKIEQPAIAGSDQPFYDAHSGSRGQSLCLRVCHPRPRCARVDGAHLWRRGHYL